MEWLWYLRLIQVSEKSLRCQASLCHISICENEDKRKRKRKLRMNAEASDAHSILLRKQTQQNKWSG